VISTLDSTLARPERRHLRRDCPRCRSPRAHARASSVRPARQARPL
jgi:hypothetical protein